MIIGTLCFSQSARSCSSRLFERCTIWFTANGADGRSGCALSCAASSCLIRTSHSSSSAGGRALSAGNEPTIPALHWAITRSGTEMMNSGAPIAGIERRPLNSAGIDIGEILVFRMTGNPAFRSKDARHHIKEAIALFGFPWQAEPGASSPPQEKGTDSLLLAQSASDKIVGSAIVRFAGPARNQHFRRTGLHRIRRQAFAFLETLRLTELVGGGLAVRRAIGRDRTLDAALGHG